MPISMPSPRHRPGRRARLAAAPALVAVSLALAGCGASGDENADPAKIAPHGSLMYIAATIRPEGDQKQAIEALSSKVLKVPDPGKRIQQELDESFRRDSETRDVTYADDIAPWLGRRAAVAITGVEAGKPQFAVIAASQDGGAAREALERQSSAANPRWASRTYKGVDYFYDPEDRTGQGVVGDYAVVASEPAFKATVDASENGSGLAEKPAFTSASAGSEDKLGFAYVDVKSLLAALNASGQLPPGAAAQLQGLLGSGAQPATISLDAQPDRVTLESVARGVRAPVATDTPLVGALPADSWLALGSPQVGRELRRTVSQLSGGVGEGVLSVLRQQLQAQTGLDFDRDVLPSLGDVALFMRGSSLLTVGGGIVVETPDPAAARRVVGGLGPLVTREGGAMGLRVASTTVGGAQGFKVTSPRFPGAVNVVAGRDRMVIAYGDSATSAALLPQGRLEDAPAYRAARDSIGNRPPQLFMEFAPIAQLLGVSADPEVQRARTYLSALGTLAAGSSSQGDTRTGQMVITVK